MFTGTYVISTTGLVSYPHAFNFFKLCTVLVMLECAKDFFKHLSEL